MVRSIPTGFPQLMTESLPKKARARIAPAGLVFLAITSIGWGFNWPVTKFLIGELPPLTLRGVAGVIGAGAGRARAAARTKPERLRPDVAAACARGTAQCHRLDGADGACVAVAAGERGGVDRLYDAGMGRDAGLAGARRAADRD